MCTIRDLDRYIGRYIDRYNGQLTTDYRLTVDPLFKRWEGNLGREGTQRTSE